MKDRCLKSTVPEVGEVWKVNLENDVEVIVAPKGFITKELKERGYKFKCTSFVERVSNKNENRPQKEHVTTQHIP